LYSRIGGGLFTFLPWQPQEKLFSLIELIVTPKNYLGDPETKSVTIRSDGLSAY
jgi:hypothetical protein